MHKAIEKSAAASGPRKTWLKKLAVKLERRHPVSPRLRLSAQRVRNDRGDQSDHGKPGNRGNQQLDSGVHCERSSGSMPHPGAIACAGTLERSRTQNSHTALYSIDEKNSSKAGGLLRGANMGESTSNRFGVFRAVVLLAYGSLAACSALPAEPAPVSVFPIDRITGADYRRQRAGNGR